MIRSRVLLVGMLLASGAALVVGADPTGAAPSPPQVTLDPQRGLPGTRVLVTPQTETAGHCTAAWDNDPAVDFFCGPNDSNGQFGSTTLIVPAAASPGTHHITVCQPQCASASLIRSVVVPVWAAAVPFTVSTVVPDLADLSVAAARNLLNDAHLKLGNVTGSTNDPQARVAFQSPPVGSAVDPGSAVNVGVAGAAPPPVSPPVTPAAGAGQLPLSGAHAPNTGWSWHPELIAAIATGAGLLLLALVAADAAVRRNRRRRARQRRRPQVYLRSSRGAHSVTICDTGRSATHAVSIVSHRHFTVTSGKALR